MCFRRIAAFRENIADGRILPLRPAFNEFLFDRLPDSQQGERNPALRKKLRFHPFVQCLPDIAVLGPIAPIGIDCCSWTLALAHDEEATATTAVTFLWRLGQGQVPFIASGFRFDEIDPLFVRSPTIRFLPIALDSAHRARRVRIAGIPYARRSVTAVVLSEQHARHVRKHIELQAC